ncbi:LA2681 family HEPN domain-containing protein [Frigoribacterium sp. 2-23]
MNSTKFITRGNEVRHMPREVASQVNAVVLAAQNGHSACVKNAESLVGELDRLYEADSIDGDEWALAAFTVSSVLINFAGYRRNKRAAKLGTDIADRARLLAADTHLRRNLEYNAGNGRSCLHQLAHDRAELTAGQYVAARLLDRDLLKEARALFFGVGYDASVASELRGMALCNLANLFDDSGRWVEAYQAYSDALEADPTNGNASGNAAYLLRRRISTGRGTLGHYAVVHDAFVRHSKAHRQRTVDLAGEQVARNWDAVELLGGHGHAEHGGDVLDEYQQWIKDHRFALTLAVDGLGTDSARWDSAMIESLQTTSVGMPPIYASVNVLKAEYLVSRRLAFSGEQRLLDAPLGQSPDDSGVYADTLDMAVYGEASSSLVLAQRSTLDLLDKIAVAANEHFSVGLDPENVTFKAFWVKGQPALLHPALPVPPADFTPSALSLAELAVDFTDGIYEAAKTLRNAGTHRLVNLTWAMELDDKPDDATHVRIDLRGLITASHSSLAVARAAYLYLLDLVADREDTRTHDGPVFDMPMFFQD